jgi:hypothetical protein
MLTLRPAGLRTRPPDVGRLPPWRGIEQMAEVNPR